MNPSITETKIRNTLYIVSAECSPTAKETLEQKLERIISRKVTEVIPHMNYCKLNDEISKPQ